MTRRRAPVGPNTVAIPAVLEPSVAKAKARTQARRHGPPVQLHRNDDGSTEWRWPFGETEGEQADWRWLVLDAFGTRNDAVAATFLRSLLDLCSAEWDEASEEWVPDEGELTTILHIVSAHKPKDEAQAALAAQIAATHLITMKIAKRVSDYPWDTRMVGAFAKLVRANGSLIETMAAVKGRRRSTTQKITVTHDKHVHQHQHIHMEGGAPANDRQAQTAMEPRPEKNERCSALPSPDEAGVVVPISGSERASRLPNARRREGDGRAKG
tara:strand:- start:4661 stop:5467 length:807 start_codon:yes stop_codon:yes gene_type:complete